MKKVSVIASVYNCEQYIGEMIDSVIAQTYTNWEMIIIDDASMDGTWNIIEQYNDERIIPIKNSANRGLPANLNKALDLAEGDYILRIDGDDMAYPERFQIQIEYMDKNPDVVLAGSYLRVIGNEGTVWVTPTTDDELRVGILIRQRFFHPTFIIRADSLKKNRIRYNEDFIYAQDYELTYRLSRIGRIGNVPYVLMRYRIHDNAISIKHKREQDMFANAVKERQLLDVGVMLSSEDKKIWLDVCGRGGCISEIELSTVQRICNMIIAYNKSSHYFDDEYLDVYLRQLCRINNDLERDIKHSTEKYLRYYNLVCDMIDFKNRGFTVGKLLKFKGINKTAVYGSGRIGLILCQELSIDGVEVSYLVDRNPEAIPRIFFDKYKKPYVKLEDENYIVITAIAEYEDIKKNYKGMIKCISLEELVYELKLMMVLKEHDYE